MRGRIERVLAALHKQIPDGMDLEEAVDENPDLANDAAVLVSLMHEEQDFLAEHGVDYRPFNRYEHKL